MASTVCTCIGELWHGLWTITVPDDECRATHRAVAEL